MLSIYAAEYDGRKNDGLNGGHPPGARNDNCSKHSFFSLLFCFEVPSGLLSLNLLSAFLLFLHLFRKNVKFFLQGRKMGIKKAGPSSLRMSPARLKGVKKKSRTPPGMCQRPDQEPAPKIRGSARQELLCTQLSCRLHFVIGCKYEFYLVGF